jgi:hypothetical protein
MRSFIAMKVTGLVTVPLGVKKYPHSPLRSPKFHLPSSSERTISKLLLLLQRVSLYGKKKANFGPEQDVKAQWGVDIIALLFHEPERHVPAALPPAKSHCPLYRTPEGGGGGGEGVRAGLVG